MEEKTTLNKHLDTLNEMQKKAVFHFGNPLLIRAGAGSGKTRVITTKIAYLIEKEGINPNSILALTFTNKAAKEMRERAMSLSNKSYNSMIKTFHSFGVWFLRQYATLLGLDPHFTIYDTEASHSLLAHIKLRITTKEKLENNFGKIKQIKEREGEEVFEVSLTKKEVEYFYQKIARAKDYCLTCDAKDLSKIDKSSAFRTLYKEYQKKLTETGNVDFGDLILLPYLILKSNMEVRAKMQNKFSVIMVDEYQDTNIAQVELLKLLVGDFQYICVVGDEDQAIYKFRGAEIKNILDFSSTFKGTDVITLDKNYRSYGNILNVANSIISHNKERFKKELKTTRGEGEKTQVAILENQDSEADFCASLIEQYTKEGYSPGEWAIIYRINRQSRSFETTLLSRNIPYVVVGGVEFYQREEVRDAISFLSLIVNGRDEVAIRRLMVKYIKGFGEKKCDEILNKARKYILENDSSILESDFITIIPIVLKDVKRMNKDAKPKIENFISSLSNLRSMIFSDKIEIKDSKINEAFFNTLAMFVEHVLKTFDLYSIYKEKDENDKTDKEGNLQEFVNSATPYECNHQGLVNFMEYINLREELENKDGRRYEDSVKLMTMHTTKGLEFKNVIVTGLEKGLFPRFEHDIEEVEEERRLMYVSCTRAMDHLFITSCRYRRSIYSDGYTSPSMFLSEIKNELVDSYEIKNSTKTYISLFNLFQLEKPKYEVDMCVHHKEYGYGRVEKVKEVESECYIIVHFFQTDQKKIFLPEHTKDLTIRHDIKIKTNDYNDY